MRDRLLVISGLLAALHGLSVLSAAQGWKDRPYTEWSPEDVRQVLNDSPWAKQVVVTVGWVQTGVPSQSNIPGADQKGQRQTVTEAGGMGGPGGATKGSAKTGVVQGERKVQNPFPTGAEERWFFMVRWESSLAVREALVRSRQLKGPLSEADATRVLSVVPEEHSIVVTGPSVVFAAETEETIRASAHLKLGRSNKEVPAASAKFLRDGERIVAVWLTFPKQQQGLVLITPQERKVKFFCMMGKVKISTDFELDKMIRKGLLDI